MESRKRELDQLEEVVNKIVTANNLEQKNLFGETRLTREVVELLDIREQDPELSYNLYYRNIQPFLNLFIPKDDTINRPIRELICILLTGKEKKNITYGTRGADSRSSLTSDMEDIIEVLSDWSETPNDYFRLTNILLNKNKELGFIPEDRTIQDYIPKTQN